VTNRGPVVEAQLIIQDLALAATELVRSQFLPKADIGVGLESISRRAGTTYFEAGIVDSVDDGILLFHAQITRDKPGLRRTLRRIDRLQGRLPRKPRTRLQRLNDRVMRGKGPTAKGQRLRRTKAQNDERKRLLDEKNKAVLRRLGIRRR